MKIFNLHLNLCWSVTAFFVMMTSVCGADSAKSDQSSLQFISSNEPWWTALAEAHSKKMYVISNWREIRQTKAYSELLQKLDSKLIEYTNGGRRAIFWETIEIGDMGASHRLGILVDGKMPVLIWAYGYEGQTIHQVVGETPKQRLQLVKLFQSASRILESGPTYSFSPIDMVNGWGGGWGYMRMVKIASEKRKQCLIGGPDGTREEKLETSLIQACK